MKRWLLHLALILPVLDPIAVFAEAWTVGEHRCSDHICMCTRSCPPKRSAQEPCHRAKGSAARIRGICHHDQASVLQSSNPATLPSPPPQAVPVHHEFAGSFPGDAPRAGFARIDPQPPRSR